jgi:hypothetical protein
MGRRSTVIDEAPPPRAGQFDISFQSATESRRQVAVIASDFDENSGGLKFNQRALGYYRCSGSGLCAFVSGDPEEDRGNTQYSSEQSNPIIGWIPHYAAIGGLLLGNCINFLGGWLYYNDDRLRWTRRKRCGLLIALIGCCVVFGGYWLSAATGGGY